ncbi:MAG: hypothetical protein V2A75_01475 [Pseudomonadota bacterium]
MRKLLLILLICGGLLQLEGETLVVVSGNSFGVDSMNVDEIRGIYLGKRFRLGGKKIIPLNLGIDNPLRNQFEQNILEEDRNTLAQYWLQAHYLGHRTPKVFKSQESIAEFLSKVDNTVGYVDEEIALKYHLKILFKAKE